MSARYSDPYLDWTPLRHTDGCTAPGWQVRAYSDENLDGREVEVGLRADCPSCQASYELVAPTGHVSENGDVDGPYIAGGPRGLTETYTLKPVKVPTPKGSRPLWMHGHGRRRFSGDFDSYYVTASAQPPTEHEQILGTVGTRVNRRGNVKNTACLNSVRELGARRRHKILDVTASADRDFATPRAAAKWIATQLAEADHR